MEVSKETPKLCPICKKEVHPDARRCNGCQRYIKGPRKYMDVSQTTLAFLSAIASAVAAVLAWGSTHFFRDSQTTVTFLSATQSVITISATNSGQSPSVIRSVWLKFDELPVDDQELVLFQTKDDKTDSNAVPASGSVTVRYVVPEFRRTVSSYNELTGKLDDDSEIEKPVTLEFYIQESDDSREEPTVLSEQVPIHRLAELIRTRTAEQQKDPS